MSYQWLNICAILVVDMSANKLLAYWTVKHKHFFWFLYLFRFYCFTDLHFGANLSKFFIDWKSGVNMQKSSWLLLLCLFRDILGIYFSTITLNVMSLNKVVKPYSVWGKSINFKSSGEIITRVIKLHINTLTNILTIFLHKISKKFSLIAIKTLIVMKIYMKIYAN